MARNRKLSRLEAIAVCDLRGKKTATETASHFGISSDSVNLIWAGKRWAELKHPNQHDDSKPRLTPDQHDHLKSLCGQLSPQEAAVQFNLSVKRVLAIWRLP